MYRYDLGLCREYIGNIRLKTWVRVQELKLSYNIMGTNGLGFELT